MSPFAHLTRSGDRADPAAATLPCGRCGEERSEVPFLILVVLLTFRLVVVLVSAARESGTHQEPATTALARGRRDQRRQGPFVFVLVLVFLDAVVFEVPASERRTHQQAAATPAAKRARQQEPAKPVFLVVVFVLVFDLVAFMTSASECETHEKPAATPTAYRRGEKQPAQVPLVVVFVLILVLDIVIVGFARFARERRQADHATALAASQSSCQCELSCTAHLFQTINVVIGILGHWPSLSSDVGHLANVPPSRTPWPPIAIRAFVCRTLQ